MARPALLLALLALASCRSEDRTRTEPSTPVDSIATDAPARPQDTVAPPSTRCAAKDGFVSVQRPDSIWLSVPDGSLLDTTGAGMHTDTLNQMDFFKLARTNAGYVYFDFGPSADPSFTLLDVDSAHIHTDRFVNHPRTFEGTELRILDDSTVEACGIADAYTNRSRVYRLDKDSLRLLRCTLLDTIRPRVAKTRLQLHSDSLLSRPSCVIAPGTDVRVTMAAMKPGGQCIESGVFLIRSESCSGWLQATGNEDQVTDLFYHGD